MAHAVAVLMGVLFYVITSGAWSPALAAAGIPFELSGRPNVYVDTNQNHQLDLDNDGHCSASVIPVDSAVASGAAANPLVGSSLFGNCEQGEGPNTVELRALGWFSPSAAYEGKLESLKMAQNGELLEGSAQQTSGSVNSNRNNIFGAVKKNPVGDGKFRPLLKIIQAGEGSEGVLCDLGGPAAQVMAVGGACLIRRADPVSEELPDYLRVPGVPFEETYNGFGFFDIFIPITPGPNPKFSLSVGDLPPSEIPFSALAACTGCAGPAAPALAEWALIGLALSLLLIGTWTISRRRGFYESLPLP